MTRSALIRASRGALHGSDRLTARGAAAGVGAAAAVILLRQTHLLRGPLAIALACLTALAIPTAHHLSRRILLTGTAAMGWIVLLYWQRIPTAGVGRVTAAWAVTAGALAWWVGCAPHPARRLRRLVPGVLWVDAVPVLTAIGGAWVWRPWLGNNRPGLALGILFRSWDNVSHFNMTHMIRLHGVTTDTLGRAADGTSWDSWGYPQGFHALTAAVMEAWSGTASSDLYRELMLYVRATGVVAVAAAVLGTSAVCAIPAVRRNAWTGVPLAGVVGATFVLGPGAFAIYDGFPNFLVAIALTVAVAALAVIAARPARPVMAIAVIGGLVGVANTWFGLMLVAAPSAAVAFLPPRRRRWPTGTRAWSGFAVVCVAGAYGVLHAFLQVRQVPMTSLATAGGQITRLDPSRTALAALLAVGLGATLFGSRRDGQAGWRTRVTAGAAAIAGAGIVVAALGAVQIAHTGALSYYFWKAQNGLQVAAIACCAWMAATLAARVVRRRGVTTAVAATSFTAAALLLFGMPFSARPAWGLTPQAPGIATYAFDWVSPTASGVLQAAHDADPAAAPREIFVALKTPDSHPLLTYLWFNTLTGTWTERRDRIFRVLDRLESGNPRLIGPVTRRILDREPGMVLLTSRADARTICAALHHQAPLCRRIRVWE